MRREMICLVRVARARITVRIMTTCKRTEKRGINPFKNFYSLELEDHSCTDRSGARRELWENWRQDCNTCRSVSVSLSVTN